jgi:hypothetical protein
MLVAVSPLFLILPTMLVATTSYIDSAISARAVLEPLGATPVGLCGGDDWEPEIAADHLGHVYVVFAHFPGDASCVAESGAPREIFAYVGPVVRQAAGFVGLQISLASDDQGGGRTCPRVLRPALRPTESNRHYGVDPSVGGRVELVLVPLRRQHRG